MSKKSTQPDAWEDDWETAADKLPTSASEAAAEPKKVSSKVTKAQRRAQQAEFNRQLWAEAEGPRETNYFLETNSNSQVPFKSEFKPAPVLLSRKGPTTKTATDGMRILTLQNESSDDEEDASKKMPTAAERQLQAAKEREAKQRKYEERRQELFGSSGTSTKVSMNTANGDSGNTTPRTTTPTPPGSGSTTPSRSRGRGGPRRGGAANANNKERHSKELFDPSYTPKPDPVKKPAEAKVNEIHPSREPKGPDASKDGFAPRPKMASHDNITPTNIFQMT